MWFSWVIIVLGYGLMIQLDEKSNTSVFYFFFSLRVVMIFTRCFFYMFLSAEKVLYLLVSALGVGCLFQTPLIGLQAAMPLKDMATSTSTFGFIRTLGGTVGISVGQAILSGVSSSFNNIQYLVIPFFNILIIITSLTSSCYSSSNTKLLRSPVSILTLHRPH